jgi:chromate transporter
MFQLFIYFFLLGFLTFGGGLAMLPFMKKHGISKGWIDEQSWDELVTLAQLAPGAVAVNCANLLGLRVKGKLGSIVAIFGMILPSILIILALTLFLETILSNSIVVAALKGILIVVLVLFVYAFIDLTRPLRSVPSLFIWVIVSFALVYFQILSPIVVMAVAFIYSTALFIYKWYRK